jgi:hypothetical protein
MRKFLLAPLLLVLSLAGAFAAPARAADHEFAGWAAVVIAGDWRSHAGGDTDAFDNTRRDVSAALVRAGFDAANVRQYSLRPARPSDDPRIYVSPKAAIGGFEAAAQSATKGCLFYLSSHGSPDGAVFGPKLVLSPSLLRMTLDQVCGERPTVVIISACYSGVFIEPLESPNRVILTAARPDRSSFGCSDKDRYPYFDACILQSMPASADFLDLARRARICVAKRETDEHLEPASEPQTWIGGQAKLWEPFLRLGVGR